MTRRRLIWAIVAAVVFFTVGFFLSGEARADTLQADVARQANWFAVATLAVIVAISLFNLAWNATKWLFRLGDWAWQNRPPSKRERALAETFNTHAEQAMHVANHRCDGAVCPVCEPTRTAVEGMVAWAAEQDRLELERLWAMDEAEEPRRTT